MTDKQSPKHYQGFSNGAEVIDIAERLNFNRGNVVKYTARAGRKQDESAIDDLKKALVYLTREIARIENDGIEVPRDTGFVWNGIPVMITPEARQ